MCVRKDNKTVLYLIGRIRSEKQRDPATKQATAKKKELSISSVRMLNNETVLRIK